MTVTTTPQKLPRFPWIGKRPFYGWVVVAVGWMTQFNQGITSQGFATYLGYLQKEFGWSRAALAGPRSITQAENAVLGPIQGYLVDRLGPRINMVVGTLLMGLGLILFGSTHSLFMFYVSNIIIALGTSFQGLLVVSVAINHWFRRKRTLAQSLMLLGFSTAGVIGIPALVLVETSMGWRNSTFVTGILVIIVGIPSAILIRRSPEPYGLLPDGDVPAASDESEDQPTNDEYDFTLRQALRTRAFWLLAIGLALGNLGQAATGTHLYLHLENGVGLSPQTAAFVWSVASVTNIPMRLIGGFFGDRLPKHFVLAGASGLMALSTLVLGLSSSLSGAMAFAVVYGIGWGLRTPVMNSIQGEYFGRKSQGIIRGWLQSITVPVTIAAPILVGHIADVQGTYRLVFSVMAFIGLAGSSVILLATPPKPPTSAV